MMRLLASLAIAAAMTAGCESPNETGLHLVIHLDQAQAWTASGGSVEQGWVCASGTRHQVGYLDLAEQPLSFQEWIPRWEAAVSSGGEEVDYLLDIEHTCADGSGSFVLREYPGMEVTWRLVSGTSRYDGRAGAGTCAVEFAEPEPGDPEGGTPKTLICDGVLSGGEPAG